MIETFLRVLGFGLCHQLPQRSFFGGGYQLPVCARDTGIYVGFVLSLLVMALLDRGRRRSELPHPGLLALGVLFVGIMGWDGVTSYAGLRQTTNDLRLITGLLTGYALPLVVVPMLNSSLWDRSEPTRVLDRPLEIVAWLASIPAAFVLIRWLLPLLGVVYPLLAAACILTTFVSVNLIVVTLAPRFERRARRLRGAWMPILLALVVSVAEVGGAGLLRMWLQSLARVG
ncbi:MAG TPA: DUF2085 domain-containing protein [Coriobacteriia bacterium]